MNRPIPPPPGLVVLPQAVRGMACADCHRTGARWARVAPEGDQIPVCSPCIVYRSPWGEANAEGVELLLALRAARRAEVIPRDALGRAEADVLDLILLAIILPARLAARRAAA